MCLEKNDRITQTSNQRQCFKIDFGLLTYRFKCWFHFQRYRCDWNSVCGCHGNSKILSPSWHSGNNKNSV